MSSGGGGKVANSPGFTLAEVLITLGIIGVVAAMTLPSLVGKYKDKVFITQTKKTYSLMLTALNNLKVEMGASDYTGVFLQSKTKDEIANMFFSQFKTLKICKVQTSGCTVQSVKYPSARNDGTGKNSTYKIQNGFYRAVLPDGSVIGIDPYVGGDANCGRVFVNYEVDENGNYISDGNGGYKTKENYSTQCGVLLIDANGIKGPNQINADVYLFVIKPKNIINFISKIESVLTDESLQYTDYIQGEDFEK